MLSFHLSLLHLIERVFVTKKMEKWASWVCITCFYLFFVYISYSDIGNACCSAKSIKVTSWRKLEFGGWKPMKNVGAKHYNSYGRE